MFIAFRSNNSDDPYLKLKTLTQVIRLVQDGYFEEIDMTKALEGAIRGFLEELDPHSKYISNDEFEAVNEQMEGEFEGIGIEVIDGRKVEELQPNRIGRCALLLLHQHVQTEDHQHTAQGNQKQQGFHQRCRHVINEALDV